MTTTLTPQQTLTEMVHDATKEYHPGTDQQVAAQNFLRYGLLGYAIPVGETSLGFCNNENIAQNPGMVPPGDVPDLTRSMAHALRRAGRTAYARAVEKAGHQQWFNPGNYRS